MNFIIENWYLFLLAIVSGTLLLFPQLLGDNSKNGISINDAVLLMNREKGVLVDVRDPVELATGRIVQAKNIPLSQLEEKLSSSVKNKTLPVLFICATGARSASAVKMAQKLGYNKVFSVAGGLNAWAKANMPVLSESQAG